MKNYSLFILSFIFLAQFLVLSFFAHPAQAISRSYTRSCEIELSRTDWNRTCGLERFSTDNGSLTQVKLEFLGYVEGSVKLENKDSEQKTITASYTNTLTLSGADNKKVLENPIKLSFTEALPAFDGVSDFGGASGRQSAKLTSDKTSNIVLNADSGLDAYIGSGLIQLPVSARGSMNVEGGSNASVDWDTYARARVIATYTYEAHDLSIRKTHQGDNFKTGDVVNFTLTVKNEDNRAFTDRITVVDVLPPGLSYQGFSGDGWSCNHSGREVNCSSDNDLGAGASTNLNIRTRIDDGANGTLTNTARVIARGDGNPDNNNVTDWIIVGSQTTAFAPTPTPTPQVVATPIANTTSRTCDALSNPKPVCAPVIESITTEPKQANLSIEACADATGCSEFLVLYGNNPDKLDQKQRFSVPEDDSGSIKVLIEKLTTDTAYYFTVQCANACHVGEKSKMMRAITNPSDDLCPKIYTQILQTPALDYQSEHCENKEAILGATTEECTIIQQTSGGNRWWSWLIGALLATLFWLLLALLLYFFKFRKKENQSLMFASSRKRSMVPPVAMRRRDDRNYSQESL